MPGNNAGQRVRDLADRVASVDANNPMTIGLSQLLRFAPTDPYREHALRLEQILRQLDLVRDGLERSGFPKSLYEEQLGLLRGAFSPSALNQSFVSLRQAVRPDVQLALRWAAHVLEDEGDSLLDGEQLDGLAAAIGELIAEIDRSSLPSVLRSFLATHLRDILLALQMRAITGVESLQEVVRKLAADIFADGAELAEASAHVAAGETALVDRASGALRQAVDVASSSGRTSEGVRRIWRRAMEDSPTLGWDAQAFENLV